MSDDATLKVWAHLTASEECSPWDIAFALCHCAPPGAEDLFSAGHRYPGVVNAVTKIHNAIDSGEIEVRVEREAIDPIEADAADEDELPDVQTAISIIEEARAIGDIPSESRNAKQRAIIERFERFDTTIFETLGSVQETKLVNVLSAIRWAIKENFMLDPSVRKLIDKDNAVAPEQMGECPTTGQLISGNIEGGVVGALKHISAEKPKPPYDRYAKAPYLKDEEHALLADGVDPAALATSHFQKLKTPRSEWAYKTLSRWRTVHKTDKPLGLREAVAILQAHGCEVHPDCLAALPEPKADETANPAPIADIVTNEKIDRALPVNTPAGDAKTAETLSITKGAKLLADKASQYHDSTPKACIKYWQKEISKACIAYASIPTMENPLVCSGKSRKWRFSENNLLAWHGRRLSHWTDPECEKIDEVLFPKTQENRPRM